MENLSILRPFFDQSTEFVVDLNAFEIPSAAFPQQVAAPDLQTAWGC